MRKTRRDRKNYNEGRADGWAEGYKQGLHDGNPFNRVIEALSDMVKTITANPELMAEVMKEKNHITPKDGDETWKEDMQRDADAYYASQEDEE